MKAGDNSTCDASSDDDVEQTSGSDTSTTLLVETSSDSCPGNGPIKCLLDDSPIVPAPETTVADSSTGDTSVPVATEGNVYAPRATDGEASIATSNVSGAGKIKSGAGKEVEVKHAGHRDEKVSLLDALTNRTNI